MVQVQNVSVGRGGLALIENVSFELAQSDILVLRGPNGIGKTTFLRACAGLQPLIAGRIDVPDLAFAGHADAIKGQLTVAQNLAFWASVYGTNVASDLTDAFNITGLLNRTAGLLSAGQKRRLGLARVAVSKAPLWLLDEPTVSLDPASIDMFVKTLRAHVDDGGMAILSTHVDLPVQAKALNLADYKARAITPGSFDGAFL